MSVVAIALFRQPRPGKDRAAALGRRDLPGIPQIAGDGARPDDPEFLPSEYGTGVVIDRKGLILTNYHVLGHDTEDYQFEYYVTTNDRKSYKAQIKAHDPRSDLAVLEIAAQDLTPIALGDAATLKKGHIVIALGNPYAIARDGQPSASWGIVSNLARKNGPTPQANPRSPTGSVPTKQTLSQFGTLIQTDAKLNLGTSGGALLNLKGEMIGLTTALAATAGAEQAAGFAIPVDEAFRRVLDTLKQGREVEFGFLGIRPANLTLEERSRGLKGLRVDTVYPGTPAERAGLRTADVITQVNGRPVLDADELVLSLSKLHVDAVVRLSVMRNDQPSIVQEVTLAKFVASGKPFFTVPRPTWRGLSVDYPTARPDFRDRSPAPQDPCVYVTAVDEDSPAAALGVKQGMFITHVAGTRVKTPKEFDAVVAGKTGPIEVRLLVAPGEGGDPLVPRGPLEQQIKMIAEPAK
jgi:serine protease Do